MENIPTADELKKMFEAPSPKPSNEALVEIYRHSLSKTNDQQSALVAVNEVTGEEYTHEMILDLIESTTNKNNYDL